MAHVARVCGDVPGEQGQPRVDASLCVAFSSLPSFLLCLRSSSLFYSSLFAITDVVSPRRRTDYISWLYALLSSSLIYLLLVYFFPPASIVEARKASFEQWADDQRALLDCEVSIEAVTAAKMGGEADLEEKKGEGEGEVVPVAPYEGRV